MNYNVLPENDLLVLLKQNDRLAFEQLYHNYGTKLYLNVLALVKLNERAEEIAQHVFIDIWKNRQLIDSGQPFKDYLFKVAQDLVYSFLRKAALNKKSQNTLLLAALNSANNRQEKIDILHETDSH